MNNVDLLPDLCFLAKSRYRGVRVKRLKVLSSLLGL